jgi:hypothetical protein
MFITWKKGIQNLCSEVNDMAIIPSFRTDVSIIPEIIWDLTLKAFFLIIVYYVGP